MAQRQVDAPIDAHALGEQGRVPRARVVPHPPRPPCLGVRDEARKAAGTDLLFRQDVRGVVDFDGDRALGCEAGEDDVH